MVLTGEVDRIQKESVRLLELEKKKNKKLQQTIEEKGNSHLNLDLMIAYLRSQLGDKSTSLFCHNTAPVLNDDVVSKLSLKQKDEFHPKSVHEEDSLNFSQDNDPLVLTFTKKDLIVLET